MSSGFRRSFDALADRLGIVPQIAAEIDDMAMLRLLAREGAGLAVIPPIVVRDELEAGILTEIQQLPGISETFYAVTVRRIRSCKRSFAKAVRVSASRVNRLLAVAAVNRWLSTGHDRRGR